MTRRLLIGLLGFALAGCDTVASHYPTLADARSDRLFERGWLPDILPASSTSIRVSNDVDTNVSEGEFRFAPAEFHDFERKLALPSTLRSPHASMATLIHRREKEGYRVLTYTEGNSVWVFFCREAQALCQYHMWPVRNAG